MDAMTDPAESGLLTVLEASDMLKCGKQKIYSLGREGKLELVKLGRSTRVTMASLHRLIKELPRKGGQS